MDRNEAEKIYDKILTKANLPRKGKSMPYTSANGYMFSQLNKAGEIGIRLPKEDQKVLIDNHQATPFISYGAKMRDYVKIPEDLLNDIDFVAELLRKGHHFVSSLPPK